ASEFEPQGKLHDTRIARHRGNHTRRAAAVIRAGQTELRGVGQIKYLPGISWNRFRPGVKHLCTLLMHFVSVGEVYRTVVELAIASRLGRLGGRDPDTVDDGNHAECDVA